MGKKNKRFGDGPMSPDNAMDLINSIIDGSGSLSDLNRSDDYEIREDDLFGLEYKIWGPPKSKKDKEPKSFKERATKDRNHKKIPKVNADITPDIPEVKVPDVDPVEMPTSDLTPEPPEEFKYDEEDTELRKFIVTPVSAFGRAIIQDGISSYPFAISAAIDQDLSEDDSIFESKQAQHEVDVLRQYVISRSFPTAIFKKDKFEEEFSSVKTYDEDKFIFFSEDDNVYCYIIDDDAWNRFDEVVSTVFEDDDDKANLEAYLQSYASLAILINNPHVGFYQGTEDYLPVYEDKEINMTEEFSEYLFNDIDTVIEDSNSSGIIPIDLGRFSSMAANIVAILLGEDDDDDEEDDEMDNIIGGLLNEVNEEEETEGPDDDGEIGLDLSDDGGEDLEDDQYDVEEDDSLEVDGGEEIEEEVEETDETTSSESLDESDEGDQESIQIDADDLIDDDMEIIDTPSKKDNGIDVMGKSSNIDSMVVPVVKKHR